MFHSTGSNNPAARTDSTRKDTAGFAGANERSALQGAGTRTGYARFPSNGLTMTLATTCATRMRQAK